MSAEVSPAVTHGEKLCDDERGTGNNPANVDGVRQGDWKNCDEQDGEEEGKSHTNGNEEEQKISAQKEMAHCPARWCGPNSAADLARAAR